MEFRAMRARLYVAATATATWLAFSGALTPASASFITGQFSIGGSDIYDLTANTIEFVPGSSTITGGTGSFSGLNGTPITFDQGDGVFVHYDTLTGLFFSGSSGLSFSFTGTASFQEGGIDPTSLSIVGPGTLTLAGFDPTAGFFSLTTQGGGNGGTVSVTFSATTRAVPGPIVGAGLPGIVFACGGLIALARRRRKAA
jgi:hypothetical protein